MRGKKRLQAERGETWGDQEKWTKGGTGHGWISYWLFFSRHQNFLNSSRAVVSFPWWMCSNSEHTSACLIRTEEVEEDTLLLYNLHSNKPRRQEKGKLHAVSHLQPWKTLEPSTQNILDRLIFAKVYIEMKKCKIKVILSLKIKSNYLWEEGNQIK